MCPLSAKEVTPPLSPHHEETPTKMTAKAVVVVVVTAVLLLALGCLVGCGTFATPLRMHY